MGIVVWFRCLKNWNSSDQFGSEQNVYHDNSVSLLRKKCQLWGFLWKKKEESKTLGFNILLSQFVSVSANPSTPQAGSTARLQCEVNGLKESPSMQWRAPNGATHPGMFDLSPVAVSHAGTWTCTFSHNGQEYSETLAVTVEGTALTHQTKTLPIYASWHF